MGTSKVIRLPCVSIISPVGFLYLFKLIYGTTEVCRQGSPSPDTTIGQIHCSVPSFPRNENALGRVPADHQIHVLSVDSRFGLPNRLYAKPHLL